MANEPTLRLNLVDVYGEPLKEKVDILLRHQVLSETFKVSQSASSTINIRGLRGAPQGLYRIEIDPPSYQYKSQFINMKASGITSLRMMFPIDPNKVKSVNFPSFAELSEDLKQLLDRSNQILSFEGKKGEELFNAFDEIRRAGLLNIAAKTRVTAFANGSNVLSFVESIRELRGDRFFAVVPKTLREETKNSISSRLFRSVNGSLHHPPDGFSAAGSFKTRDHYGNLQLTFFMKSNDCVVDIDIDDAAGIEHIFQVVRNKLSGEPTHPYNIHEILVGFQHVDPDYSFNV